jgi:Sec-independent protein translocase protein TatA
VFGISFEELIVLMILALILFGPEKLPEYSEKLGRLVAKLRQSSQEVTQQFHEAYHSYTPPNPFEESRSTCPKCNHKLEHNFSFCPHCGHMLKEQPDLKEPLAS